jgi:hypothetical protein
MLPPFRPHPIRRARPRERDLCRSPCHPLVCGATSARSFPVLGPVLVGTPSGLRRFHLFGRSACAPPSCCSALSFFDAVVAASATTGHPQIVPSENAPALFAVRSTCGFRANRVRSENVRPMRNRHQVAYIDAAPMRAFRVQDALGGVTGVIEFHAVQDRPDEVFVDAPMRGAPATAVLGVAVTLLVDAALPGPAPCWLADRAGQDLLERPTMVDHAVIHTGIV